MNQVEIFENQSNSEALLSVKDLANVLKVPISWVYLQSRKSAPVQFQK